MATAEQRNHAKSFLKKSVEYLESAEANLVAERYPPGSERRDPCRDQCEGRDCHGADRGDGQEQGSRGGR
jgi:hypothetical protein